MKKETKEEKMKHDAIMVFILIAFVITIGLGNQLITALFVK